MRTPLTRPRVASEPYPHSARARRQVGKVAERLRARPELERLCDEDVVELALEAWRATRDER